MSTHNICFYGELTEIIPKLSSNTLLICSPVIPACSNFRIITAIISGVPIFIIFMVLLQK